MKNPLNLLSALILVGLGSLPAEAQQLIANPTFQGSVKSNIDLGGHQLLNGTVAWPLLTGVPTTLSGYGITDNVTQQGNAFNGVGQLVQTTSGGALPVLSGANLTSLNGANISAGTVADARLSANIPLLNGANVFTGATNYFNGGTLSLGDSQFLGNNVSTLSGSSQILLNTEKTWSNCLFEGNVSTVSEIQLHEAPSFILGRNLIKGVSP